MSRYVLSRRADRDLDKVWDDIAEDSPRRADRFVRGLHAKFRKLAQQPGTGGSAERSPDDLRELTVKPYVVFYRPIDGGVEVVRIIHGSRDIDAMSFG